MIDLDNIAALLKGIGVIGAVDFLILHYLPVESFLGYMEAIRLILALAGFALAIIAVYFSWVRVKINKETNKILKKGSERIDENEEILKRFLNED